jgi:hypothetical protein
LGKENDATKCGQSIDSNIQRGIYMATGVVHINRSRDRIMEQLVNRLSAANCQLLSVGRDEVVFKYGTYLTSTAYLIPKKGRITLRRNGGKDSVLEWEIRVENPAKAWLIFIGTIFFWAIVPPVLVYHVLVNHTKRFGMNLTSNLGPLAYQG